MPALARLGLILALALPAPALAQGVAPCTAPEGTLSERDASRLAGLEWSRLRGLAAALTEADGEARQTVAGLYANGLAPAGDLPEGDYHCRTIKLGDISPLVVYQFFDCTLEATEGGYAIVKGTGSQRFAGNLTASGDGYFYRGALHYADEGPFAYDGASERDQVGCLYKVSPDGDSYVLELPSPLLESFHDVIVLLPESDSGNR
ncbi:DUF4893 domain-containing protein [Devosia nitrariae]|uniref:DUF4893 domain-containing protein n=1 Tax=Devosia nitrariae TaxID=2071872 RepID=A0ABQ5W3V0_9HYPH|nr:DUF4893 domain-containing protein [Devosia nitrariae]GLQ54479.1 hypothetical protein GCM10010862_17380 [Devosia nitrariae]